MGKVDIILFITFRRMSTTEEDVFRGNRRVVAGEGIPIFRRLPYGGYEAVSGDAT